MEARNCHSEENKAANRVHFWPTSGKGNSKRKKMCNSFLLRFLESRFRLSKIPHAYFRWLRIESFVWNSGCWNGMRTNVKEDDYPRPFRHNIANENKQTDFLLTIIFLCLHCTYACKFHTFNCHTAKYIYTWQSVIKLYFNLLLQFFPLYYYLEMSLLPRLKPISLPFDCSLFSLAS